MDKQYEVVVYGASGYTGKLTAWKLAERGIPFIAAGRNVERLEKELGQLTELKGHDYKCVAVENTKEALVELFRGRKVVINVVGPFMQLGTPVVEACLEAGCHYFDTTGETDWMFFLKRQFGERFAGKGLILCPANSYMWAEGMMATEIALETPGIDTLNVVYVPDSGVSIASTKSFLRMCTQPQFYIQNKNLTQWEYAKAFQVNVPGEHESFNALPWSGGGESVWYEGDPRVRNCKTLVSFRNPAVFKAVFGMLEKFEAECRHLPQVEQEQITNQWGADFVSTEPSREDLDVNRCVLSCHARGRTNSVSVVLRGNSPYIQTGVLGAEAARRVLRGQYNAVGFASPAQVFGARNLLSTLAEEQLMDWEVKNV